jgi:hypothetical protein
MKSRAFNNLAILPHSKNLESEIKIRKCFSQFSKLVWPAFLEIIRYKIRLCRTEQAIVWKILITTYLIVYIYTAVWLVIYYSTSHSRIFHLYRDIAITGEGLQNLGLCLAVKTFEQGGIFIVVHLLWHGTSIFPVSSDRPPHLIASYDTQRDDEDLF